MIDENLRS